MGRLFVIMGKSATGKDSLYQEIVKRHPELHEIVTYTTRPIRAGETYGKEYFFVSREEMYQLREQGKMIECREYDTVMGPWFYFTVNDGQINFSKEEDYILISTLEGYEKLCIFYGKNAIFPIYIEVEEFERLNRAISREKGQKNPCAAEVCRRFLADEKDFAAEKLQDIPSRYRVKNDNFDKAVERIEKLIANPELSTGINGTDMVQ